MCGVGLVVCQGFLAKEACICIYSFLNNLIKEKVFLSMKPRSHKSLINLTILKCTEKLQFKLQFFK